MGGQIGDVDGDPGLHASSSRHPFGQNQPIRQMATGIDPQTTAQGEKIDQISIADVAIAAKNGQIDGPTDDSRDCGFASTTLLMISSRRSQRGPPTTGKSPSHSGWALVTTGICAKL